VALGCVNLVVASVNEAVFKRRSIANCNTFETPALPLAFLFLSFATHRSDRFHMNCLIFWMNESPT
jgi:hypothetical protein